MEKVIEDILYHTHDKWKDVEISGREELKMYLEDFIEKEPKAKEELRIISDLATGEDTLLVMKGVMNILQKKFPETHNIICQKHYFDKMRKEKGI